MEAASHPLDERLRLRADDLSWRSLDGEVVAIDVPSSTYLSANTSGALLWEMLASGASREELAARLVTEFGIEHRRAETDVASFVDALARRGLLES